MSPQPTIRRQHGASGRLPWWQWAGLISLAAALIVALLGHGGRDLAPLSLSLAVIAVAALVCWSLSSRSATSLPYPLVPLAIALPTLVAIQLIPLPLGLLKLLSPNRVAILEALRPLAPPPAFATLSIDPATTAFHLLRVLGYLLVFLFVRQLAARSGRYWLVAAPLVAIGALEAALGLAQIGSGVQASGSFRNRNHFAGLLEMTLPLAIGCGISVWRGRSSRRGPEPQRILTGSAIFAGAALMAIALAFTLSKSGFIAALGGLFCMTAAAMSATLRGPARWGGLAAAGAFFLMAAVTIPSAALSDAFGGSLADRTAEGRLPVWRDAVHVLAAYPLAGSGLGTFQTAFRRYQTEVVDFEFEFAHNDYLEAATELGIVGFPVLAAFVLSALAGLRNAGSLHSPRSVRYVAWGVTGAVAAIAIHSFTDFNLYMPANALVLAWILGIAAAFPRQPGAQAREHPLFGFTRSRPVALVLASGLLASSSACFVFASQLRDDPQMTASTVPRNQLLQALRREPASPQRWIDMGESLSRADSVDQARYCYRQALSLAPYLPSVGLKAAAFFAATGDHAEELRLTSLVLSKSELSDTVIFALYDKERLSAAEVISRGLPAQPRAAQAWLRHRMLPGTANDAAVVWEWMLRRKLAGDQVARDYVNFLYGNHSYQAAAEAWSQYRGKLGGGFLQSNWLINGDFESEPGGVLFDWTLGNVARNAVAAIDGKVAHSGSRSLRITFDGKKNLRYQDTAQTAFLLPGRYRFSAFLRAEALTSDQGIGFRFFDAEVPARFAAETARITGTSDWKPLSANFEIPQTTRLVTVQVVRQPSIRMDADIAGTVWIDTVTLSRID